MNKINIKKVFYDYVDQLLLSLLLFSDDESKKYVVYEKKIRRKIRNEIVEQYTNMQVLFLFNFVEQRIFEIIRKNY